MKRSELVSFLDSYLEVGNFDDISTNSLVVGAPGDREVKKVAVAVDASLSTFEMAVAEHADLLFVHHGLFWGSPLRVTENHYRRVRMLMENNLDLYVCHLPLDAHPLVGNNAVMAKKLSLEDIVPFASFHGQSVGVRGRFETPVSAKDICSCLGFENPVILPFGPEKIETVGIVSGSAGSSVSEALDLGLDCYITGQVEHEQYFECRERGITMIGGGHWGSEVFGVQAVASLLERMFGIESVFLVNPTHL